MSVFTKWLVENGHASSEATIKQELTQEQVNQLHKEFIEEGHEDSD